MVGGVAILVRLIRNRATGDVDVIARGEFDAGGDFHLIPPDPMPDVLQKSIERVGRDFEMPPNWLNTVIGSQWLAGTAPLPPGLKSETTWYAIGGLQLGIAGRRALVALKLYAAADTGPLSVHTQDLIAMAPVDAELTEAVDWVRQQDASEEFSTMLMEVAEYVRNNR